MKPFKCVLSTALLVGSLTSFAQTTITQSTDSTAASTGKSTYVVENSTSGFKLYLGFTSLGGSLPTGYDFRPAGSRYVALAWQKRIPLAVRGNTKLRLATGPEVAWNNFMFERSRNRLVEQNDVLVIEQADKDLRKSKLVTTQLNLPVLLTMSFRSGLTWGVGAYAGIRLDSYTKVKPVGSSSVRTHGSYNLNSVRWGLTTELGFRGQAKLFFRYEPTRLFQPGKGPDASVWALGLKI